MIVFRYIVRETFYIVWATIIISLLLMMSDMLVQYVQLASTGAISFSNIFSLLALQLPILGINLLPLAFYLGLIFVLSRMYSHSEMVALRVGGYGMWRGWWHVMVIAICVAVLECSLSLFVMPILQAKRVQQMDQFQHNVSFSKIIPRTFQAYNNKGAFYVNRVSNGVPLGIYYMQTAFNHSGSSKPYSVLYADSAHTAFKNGQQYLVFDRGFRSSGVSGSPKAEVMRFKHYAVLVDKLVTHVPLKYESTARLWQLRTQNAIANTQLQWRIALPISVLILAAFVCVLTPLKPRKSPYAAVFMAIIIYALYMNLLLVGKSYLHQSKIPAQLGLWWVHGLMLLILVGVTMVRGRKQIH